MTIFGEIKRDFQKVLKTDKKKELMQSIYAQFKVVSKELGITQLEGVEMSLSGKGVKTHAVETLKRGITLGTNLKMFNSLRDSADFTWTVKAIKTFDVLLNRALSAYTKRFRDCFNPKATVKDWKEMFHEDKVPHSVGTLLTSSELDFSHSLSQILFEKNITIDFNEIFDGCVDCMGYLLESSEPLITVGKAIINGVTNSEEGKIKAINLFSYTYDKTKVKTSQEIQNNLKSRVSFQVIPVLKHLTLEQRLI